MASDSRFRRGTGGCHHKRRGGGWGIMAYSLDICVVKSIVLVTKDIYAKNSSILSQVFGQR